MGYNNLIAIDTSFKACRCIVFYNGQIFSQEIGYILRGQDAELPLLLDRCLKDAGADISEFDAIAVVNGPGSFTGIRVGMAYAKGIAIALNCPVITLSSLEIVAALSKQDVCSAIIPIKPDVCVIQRFEKQEPLETPSQVLMQEIVQRDFKPLFALSTAVDYIAEHNSEVVEQIEPIDWNHASMIDMDCEKYNQLKAFNYDDTLVQPLYVREADVTLKKQGSLS